MRQPSEPFFSTWPPRAALLIFGAVKDRLAGPNLAKSSFRTALVGGLAAGAAFYLASLSG